MNWKRSDTSVIPALGKLCTWGRSSEVPGQSELHSEAKASLGYTVRPSLKQTNKPSDNITDQTFGNVVIGSRMETNYIFELQSIC